MAITDLPALNAVLNGIAAALLLFGYVNIRKGRQATHKKFMLGALVASAAFLTSYLIYHYVVGSVPYPYHDWTRPLYFAILIPHVILAALVTPFILIIVYRALTGQFAKHRRMARFVWPVWMFVSVTGVIVYLMLYQL
jgi:uncharacterized membrane protein YozB (DUF420 family)